VWTALPTAFTDDDKVDEAGNSFNIERCISDLKIEGHCCLGNVGEFWSMTNEEWMRIHEINVDAAKGRIPLIAGCHHQNPYEVVKLCQHAESVGIDFAIILTPYQGAKSDDAVFDFYEFISQRVNIGIVLFNIPQVYYPISEYLAKRRAKLPNVCGFKQANPSPTTTISLRQGVGKYLAVGVADEGPWIYNLAVMANRWPLNFRPHPYQVPGYLPVHDYTAGRPRRRHEQGDRKLSDGYAIPPSPCQMDSRLRSRAGSDAGSRAEGLDGSNRYGWRSGQVAMLANVR
jgi:4-hydroxy-tetrahydrodipicolinate synthase